MVFSKISIKSQQKSLSDCGLDRTITVGTLSKFWRIKCALSIFNIYSSLLACYKPDTAALGGLTPPMEVEMCEIDSI